MDARPFSESCAVFWIVEGCLQGVPVDGDAIASYDVLQL